MNCLNILTIFLLSISLSASQRPNHVKAGLCPSFPNTQVCDLSCFQDSQCPGQDKCCRTACGGTVCITPDLRQPRNLEKQGECPTKPTGPWVCSSRCGQDSDCRGALKCCKNRCGAMACTRPAEEEINENDLY